MNPKKPIKVIVGKPAQSPVRITVNPSLLDRYRKIFTELEDMMIDRTEEIDAIKLALIASMHVMLEGPHGTAKSQLADNVFNRIDGATIFAKLLMKTTDRDEIFGPTIMEKYRKDSIFEHNIAGHLPLAHFAYLDEVYRASDHLLPSMLGILNERRFHNGLTLVKCPLITAIGTTNFITDTEELAAFHDRWHIRIKVKPLESESSVLKMLQGFMEPNIAADPAKVTLTELQSLRDSVMRVVIPDDLLSLYTQIIVNATKGTSPLGYVSDRRKCVALRLVQASALLNNRSEATDEDLAAARYVITTGRELAQTQAWNSAYGKYVQEFQAFKAENVDLARLEKWCKIVEGKFDPGMKKNEAEETLNQLKKGLGSMQNQPAAEAPKTQQGLTKKARIVQKLEALIDSYSDIVK